MRQPLEITRGRTVPISFPVYNEKTGAPYVLADGELLLFGIKKDPDKDQAPIFVKAAVADPDAGEGWYLVTLHPEDTQDLAPGVYYYDIGLESGGEYLDIVRKSTFTIESNVTGKGDSYA